MNIRYSIMSVIAQILATGVLVVPFSVDLNAQNLTRLKPIVSNCRDVEREIGKKLCGAKSITFELPKQIVTFSFAKDSCHRKWPHEEYNVAPETLIRMQIINRHPNPFHISDTGQDLTTFKKTPAGDHLDMFDYTNLSAGVNFTASSTGYIADINYFPPKSYDNLRCFQSRKNTDKGVRYIFGARPIKIGSLRPSDEESETLFRTLSVKLSEINDRSPRQNSEVFLLYYAGRRYKVGESRAWLSRAKNILNRKFGIPSRQIVTVDGGFRENAVVDIFIRQFGSPPAEAEPTVHPNKTEAHEKQTVNF